MVILLKIKLKCINCDFESRDLLNGLCPLCGGLMIIQYENAVFYIDRSKPGIWRYSSLLPVFSKTISMGEGLTPVSRIDSVLIKNEKFNPTGSYIDRASSIIASYLISNGVNNVLIKYTEDFTRSLIYYLRNTSIDIDVYVDNIMDIESSDLQFFVNNDIDVLTEPNISVVNIDYVNPLTIEGLKTIVFEIYEKRIDVDKIIVPAETGLLAFSLNKGLKDLVKTGVDVDYEIIAVTFKNNEVPLLRYVKNGGIKLVEISEEEAYSSFKKLVRKGFRTKLLAAICYSIAESLERSIAIVTAGYKTHSSRVSEVKKVIREVLLNKPNISAYMIWKEKSVYSLRAFYKAIKDMELKREICFEIVNKGRRKVKLYRLC